MTRTIARTVVAVASSAGLVFGVATSAGAAGYDRDHDNRDRGWVNVCQNIREHDQGHGKDRDHGRRQYHGTYKVEDSSYRTQYVDLYGRYSCRQVEVRRGNVRVQVTYRPDRTRLTSDDYRRIYVGRRDYRTVTFYYEARGHSLAA
jgi:hypothetical protein